MELIRPTRAYAESFMEAMEELQQHGEAVFWNEIGSPASAEAYLRLVTQHAQGNALPPAWNAYSTFWLVDGGVFIGESRIRHQLTMFLRTIGGHIGYTIRPGQRRKGYGTTILRLTLPEAHRLGIDPALITCDETNIGSRKIIEANGGVFETANDQGKGKPRKLLFWASTSPAKTQ
ncbi:Predicted acetyltransferase [Catalinimonas alkaloidigena]|uniref:Predicted acetyltransferase n=1 Tax=Catalinimonas alkaloidigena TaxID=1075417 RepID=A0A1G8X087_9BACT|nr:GNAT family N-acetyltransferase [Catalinimonas alkaloidigena]SDJ83844.1 Predicted acetyltransferase [Catalinimonas alkaloidigena]